jgi:hypothetical protein
MRNCAELKAGDWVQVRSKEEILKTLDRTGRLEELPFMPEMFAFCGMRLRVGKRAHKTCDPPNGMAGRRMMRAVHLEDVRCDGAAHGGCQARCLIFWKEAWLEKVEGGDGTIEFPRSVPSPLPLDRSGSGSREQDVVDGTHQPNTAPGSEPLYVCQSTQVRQATQPIAWWDFSQYAEDLNSGNVRLSQVAAAGLFFVVDQVASAGIGLGSGLRWLYDTIQKWRGGTPYPNRIGRIQGGARTPSARLDLQPGELVRVRSYMEILATLDEKGYNRGMSFDAELVPFCGGTYRVLDRISKIINEKTGKMQQMKNECIILEGVVCRACYAKHRRFCPRAIYPYWREIWLERVLPGSQG